MTFADPLPDPLPADPLRMAAEWLAMAWERREQPNPNAMVLATSTPEGAPSARVVLCKSIEPEPGVVRFVSNYHSRKGRELAANSRAACVLHWDHMHRQVRLEGVVTRAALADSDAYFASRAWASKLGAHASAQSEPVDSRAALDAKLDEVTLRYGAAPGSGRDIPRPAHWGGYVLWIDRAELWVEGAARLHDRASFTRTLTARPDGSYVGGAWHSTRLQP